jgi:hypothetical protein
MKCEIWDCHTETEDYLCPEHMEHARDPQSGFVICESCNAIIRITKNGESFALEKELIARIVGQYIFIKDCQYCRRN